MEHAGGDGFHLLLQSCQLHPRFPAHDLSEGLLQDQHGGDVEVGVWDFRMLMRRRWWSGLGYFRGFLARGPGPPGHLQDGVEGCTTPCVACSVGPVGIYTTAFTRFWFQMGTTTC